MRNPTRRDARVIWRNACKKYAVRYVYYKNIHKILGLGPAVSTILKAISEDRSKFFKSRYMSVVQDDLKYIITPMKIGSAGRPKEQLDVLSHELQHCSELNLLRYATNKHYRAHIEGKGEAAGADIRWFMGGKALPANRVFNTRWRKVYRVSTKHSATAQKVYNKLIRRHNLKRPRFATAVGAGVSWIIRKRLG